MKTLSQSVTNILQTVTVTEDEQHTPAHGSTQQGAGDGLMNTSQSSQITPRREQPVTSGEMRMISSGIELMQQQGRLIISSETKDKYVPLRDGDGKIYGWDFDFIHTGNFTATTKNITKEEQQIFEMAVMPGNRRGIQSALERLAQVKPIGSSDVKQSTVISYLTFDLHQDGVSEFVVNELCSEYRRRPVIEPKDRFFPDNGDFLQSANFRMKKYRAALNSIKNEK